MNSPNVRLYSMPATRQPISRWASLHVDASLRPRDVVVQRSDQAQPQLCRRPCSPCQMHLYGGHPEAAIALAEKGIRLSPRILASLFGWLHSRARITG